MFLSASVFGLIHLLQLNPKRRQCSDKPLADACGDIALLCYPDSKKVMEGGNMQELINFPLALSPPAFIDTVKQD